MAELIKLYTEKKNRFGKKIQVSRFEVQVSSEGFIEIPSNQVPFFLVAGFDLVDKDQKFKSVDDLEAAEEVKKVVESAKLQATQIIDAANVEAAKIIKEAQDKAASILTKGQVDEKIEYRDGLQKLTVDQLKQQLNTAKVPEEQYKNLKKDEIIDLMLELAFPADDSAK